MSTYLRRRGRATRGQVRALAEYGPDRVIPPGSRGPLDWAARFGRAAPLGLEIGFGMGQALLDWAEAAPEMNLVGIDVYQPGIGALLLGSAERELGNLLVVEEDAAVAVRELFAVGSLREVRIFFPDPWPKKRHQKRRLIQPPFVGLLCARLEAGGIIRLATDWAPYAEWMREVLQAEPKLASETGGDFAPRFEERMPTRFETRGQRLGHQVWDLAYRKA